MEQEISIYIAQLEKTYDFFNEMFFDNMLKRPVIVILEDSTKGAYGWWTTYENWKGEESNYHEICITSENLTNNDPYKTLLHEMTHQYNQMNNVKDTSRSGTYHNSEFKKACIAHGQNVEYSKKYGWSETSLTENTIKELEIFKGLNNFKPFKVYRDKAENKSKVRNNKSIKYLCPICGQIVRATKEVYVICGNCDVEMERCY